MWCQWWSILACAHLLNLFMNRIEQVFLSLQLLQNFWVYIVARCAILFLPIFSDQRSFSFSLDTKFCLHAAGGIYVKQSFTNAGGKIQISGSLAKLHGGAVLRSSSWGLWHDFEMAVGSVRFTPWSENRKELKRFRLFAINVWCLSIPSADFSSEQDGSGRSTLGSEIKGLTGLNRYSYPCNCCRTFGYT